MTGEFQIFQTIILFSTIFIVIAVFDNQKVVYEEIRDRNFENLS